MYLCYIDESGTPDIPGNTSHFILAAVLLPISYWKASELKIQEIKAKYSLKGKEIHTAWIMRKYHAESKIPEFEAKTYPERRHKIKQIRNARLIELQKNGKSKEYRQTRKNYNKSDDYIHLSFKERTQLIEELADQIGSWGQTRIIAECIDKIYFDSEKARLEVSGQALEQVVSRVEQFLKKKSHADQDHHYGLLIHDNNQSVSKKHTELMKSFHEQGTFWIKISHIIETPLFVDSQLTSMVQLADLVAYALRRHFENGESNLFNRIKPRFDKHGNKVVGIRHFTQSNCSCLLCSSSHDQTPNLFD